jgi:hypothetical protein
MTRDIVINNAVKWMQLMKDSLNIADMGVELDQESTDILSGALQLAREVTKESLTIYVAERIAEQQKHEQVLETIEELLQENIKDAKNNRTLDQ